MGFWAELHYNFTFSYTAKVSKGANKWISFLICFDFVSLIFEKNNKMRRKQKRGS